MTQLLLNPLCYIVVVFIIIVFFAKRNKKTSLIITGIFSFFMSLPIGVNTIIAHLEGKYAVQPTIEKNVSYNIIVLGSGKNDDPRLTGNQRLSEQAVLRTVEGVKWAHRLHSSKLIGSGPKGKGNKSQAQLIKETAVLLGINEARIYIQEEVYNTRTEAEAYVRQFGINMPLIVCTSALHMPRAVKWFRHYGVKLVIAAPACYLVPQRDRNWKDWMPSLVTFSKWTDVLKEIAGSLLIGNKG